MTTNDSSGAGTQLTVEQANALVEEHIEWAQGVARSVARAWNLDWQLDGLDGAALEALIFCARRFDPSRGIPFRGYARKRVQEAAADAARKCKGWRRTSTASSESRSRDLSAEILNIFPDLREGRLSSDDDGGSSSDGEGGARSAIREIIVGASLLAGRDALEDASPEEKLDYKKMMIYMIELELVHQIILFKLYWEGLSMRSIATEWDTDELNVIREHKVIMLFLEKSITRGKAIEPPRMRPGLRDIAARLKRKKELSPFHQIISGEKV